MKIRPLTVLAFIALAVTGFVYFSDKNSSPKQATVAVQPITPSPTPLASPNRELKPNEKFIAQLGMYITVPDGMTYREEIADDAVVKQVGFYLEKKEGEALAYQLYGLYSSRTDVSEKGIEKAKIGMDQSTVKNVTIADYKGFEGLYTGPKSHYTAILVKDNRMVTFSTYPPTPDNKNTTDLILSTVTFQ